jgi:DNA replication regulator SLD3
MCFKKKKKKRKKILTTSKKKKGHASSLSDNEFKLAPIALLPRSALPFSWLDTSTAMQSSNIFASNDEALEQAFLPSPGDRELDNNEPKVLATRLLANGAIYVVERVKRGIFAMTKLQSSIEEGEIRVAAKAASHSQMLRARSSAVVASSTKWDWREAARLADDLPVLTKQGRFDVSVVFGDYKRKKVDAHSQYNTTMDSQISIGDSFMALDSFADSGFQAARVHTPPEDGTQASRLEPELNTQDTSPTPDAIMENLRTQYLEALYISKVGYSTTTQKKESANGFRHPLHISPKDP